MLSSVQFFGIPWTIASQALLSMRFSRQDTVVGCHFLLQGIFLTQRLNPGLLHCRQILYYLSHQGNYILYELEMPGDLLMSSLHITYSYPQEKHLWNPYEMVMYFPPVENFALLHLAIIDDCNKLRTQTIINFIHAYFLLSSDAYLKAHSFVCVCFNKEQS